MSTAAKRHYSLADYMDFEHASPDRHEYYQGEIFAMTGGSQSHNRIGINLVVDLGHQLEGKPCQPFGSDTRVKVAATGLYTYPDVAVACDPEFEIERLETLVNPRVLFEVLSPSTEDYDRRTKLAHYQQIPSVREILFVAQDRYWVEHFSRSSAGEWNRNVITGTEASVELRSIECTLAMARIYSRVAMGTSPE